MKVLWQQIAAFTLVLLVALGFSAVQLADYVTKQEYSVTEETLLTYGQNIADSMTTRVQLATVLNTLEGSGISVQFYLSDGRIIYPSYNIRHAAKLTKDDLLALNQGESLKLRNTRRITDDGEVIPLAAVFIPYQRNDSELPNGFIALSAPLAQLNARIQEVTHQMYGAFAWSACFGVTLSILFAYYQTNKLKKLQKVTQYVTQGNYDVELALTSHDEFGELAQDFHTMTESLLTAQEEIKRQEKLRRQFMMDAAHEMRTPLTTMAGLVEGLQYDLIPEKQKQRSLELIGRETQRLIRLVNENLDYEKIRSNQLVLKKQRLNAYMIYQQICQQLSEKAEQKGDWIEVDVPRDVEIWADYDRIVQVLINLVTNAIQFSQESAIILKGRQLQDGVELQVQDFGIGIDVAELESIWERFYKVDVSRKNTKFGESGIGLSLVKSLVEAHQGSITVVSELGKGTTFTIVLPSEGREKK